jgi:hypothetical protein
MYFIRIIIYVILIIMDSMMKRVKSAEKSRAYAFYRYYQSEYEKHEYQEQVLELFSKLKEVSEDKVPEFLITELKEMYEITKKSIECPICFEDLSKDDIKFASCGHKYCEECLSKIDNCAICRKKIYSKK